MGAKPDILTWREAIYFVKWSHETIAPATIPHFAVGADNPGDGYVAMWSNEILVNEVIDIDHDDIMGNYYTL